MNTITSWNEQDFDTLRELLPESVLQIVRIAGVAAAVALVRHYGGTFFPMGQSKNKFGKILFAALAEVVGNEQAERLSRAFATQRGLYIPKCDTALIELRDRQIRRDFDTLTGQQPHTMPAYLAARNLAREYRLSERQIWRILKQLDSVCQPPPQSSLFAA